MLSNKQFEILVQRLESAIAKGGKQAVNFESSAMNRLAEIADSNILMQVGQSPLRGLNQLKSEANDIPLALKDNIASWISGMSNSGFGTSLNFDTIQPCFHLAKLGDTDTIILPQGYAYFGRMTVFNDAKIDMVITYFNESGQLVENNEGTIIIDTPSPNEFDIYCNSAIASGFAGRGFVIFKGVKIPCNIKA